MPRPRFRRTHPWAIPLLLLGLAAPAHGASLAGKLHQFIDTNGFPTFGDFIEVVTPIVERVAIRGIDFPVTATAPAFTYEFNYETGVPERSSTSLGPTFVERPNTAGRGRFTLGAWFLHADLTQFDGEDFADQIVTAGKRTDPATGTTVAGAFVATRFSLVTNGAAFSGTYGLTDRWDVNVLLPLVWTSLDLDGNTAYLLQDQSGTVSARAQVRFHASAFGVGDLLLRTKYRLHQGKIADLAAGLALRIPTGTAGDFHGSGDTTVTPLLIAARALGRHEVHANLGVEFNADDLERTRARYALGLVLQPWDRLAFLLDMLGSSSFVDDRFTIPAPAGQVFHSGPNTQLFGNDDLVASVGRREVVAFVPRSDVVDLAVGVKVNLIRTVVAFASAVVPLTSDGLRAEVIPAAGVEASF
jgi:hypothetical protein